MLPKCHSISKTNQLYFRKYIIQKHLGKIYHSPNFFVKFRTYLVLGFFFTFCNLVITNIKYLDKINLFSFALNNLSGKK